MTLQRARARLSYARAARHADAGFTLIEAVVALVIFTVVASAGTFAVVTGIKGNNATNDRIAATHLAQQQIDQTRALPQASLTPTATTTSASVGSKSYSVQRVVSYLPAGSTACPSTAPTDTTVHEIRITVVVTVPGTGRTVQMDAVRSC